MSDSFIKNNSFYGLTPTLPNQGADIFFADRRTGATGKIGYLTSARMHYASCLDATSYLDIEVALDPAPLEGAAAITASSIIIRNPEFGSRLVYGGVQNMKIKNVKFKNQKSWPYHQFNAIKVTWAYSENTTEIQIHRDDVYYSREELLMQCFALYKLGIKKLIFSGPATIAIWNDKKKTVVKCKEDEDAFNTENGLYLCVMKKFMDDSSIRHCFNTWIKE